MESESQDNNAQKIKALRARRASLIKEINRLNKLFREFANTNERVRTLDPNSINDKHNIISLFESVLTRTLELKASDNIKEMNVYDDIIIVKSYSEEILKQLIERGFLFNEEKYLFFSSSAGQIRERKGVFIKESAYKKHSNTLMCGLTIEKINELGGMNVNKFLAYLALSMTASAPWHSFNINKCVVVEDFSSSLHTTLVDHIDEQYNVERKEMPVTINHTDGCGMILPSKSQHSFMTRLPWIKGLLVPFDFAKFAKDSGNTIVTDIYGKQYDIVKDKIEVIFTKSQFKMWKYYSSWQEYQRLYKKNNCQAAQFNKDDSEGYDTVRLNYQFFQTLEITDEEIQELSKPTTELIKGLASSKEKMLEALGATQVDNKSSYLQRAANLYPPLLHTPFLKRTIKMIKASNIRQAKAARLIIDGLYCFVIPDLYAFCEHVFLGIENPKGLLANGEVYCRHFKNDEEVDCLRSPHLYREHAVRVNRLDNRISQWFTVNGVFTSVHDPISRLLQFDVDGDKVLVSSNKTLVGAAHRSMESIVPLYYTGGTALAEPINHESLFKGMVEAYRSSNVGEYSNKITKAWNEEGADINLIKILTCLANYAVDFAKTRYCPPVPEDIQKKINSVTSGKLPGFFVYAKDKSADRVNNDADSNTPMARLRKNIPNHRLHFKPGALEPMDYSMLIHKKDEFENYIARIRNLNDADRLILDTFDNFNKQKHQIKVFDEKALYQYSKLYKDIAAINPNVVDVTDLIITYTLYIKKSEYAETIWKIFGREMLLNIQRNMSLLMTCQCGKETLRKKGKVRCEDCSLSLRREYKKQKERERRNKKNARGHIK
nr:hypothetical protein [Saccharibacillus deserti]